MTRRSFIAALASAASAGLGGCGTPCWWRTGRIRLGLPGVSVDAFTSVFPAFDESRVELVSVPDDRRKLASLAKTLDLEAVYLAGPPEKRAAFAVSAMKAGLHVYSEPLPARTLWELCAFNRVARESGVVTQMGDFESAGSGFRRAVELIASGAVGAVKEARAWYGDATDVESVRALNLPFRALELGRVRSVKGAEGGAVELSFAQSRSRLQKNMVLPPRALTVYPCGTNPPESVLKAYAGCAVERPRSGWFLRLTKGVAFSGPSGALFVLDGARAVPAQEVEVSGRLAVEIPRRPSTVDDRHSHLDEFLDAVRGKGEKCRETMSRAYSDTAHSVALSEIILIAGVAEKTLHPGESMRWDSAIMHFDRADANALIRPKDWKSFPQ